MTWYRYGDQAQDGPRHGIASESIWPGSPGPGRAAAVTSATVTFRLGPGVTGSVAAAAEAYYVTSTQSHSHAAVETVRVGRRGPAAGPGLARDSRLSRARRAQAGPPGVPVPRIRTRCLGCMGRPEPRNRANSEFSAHGPVGAGTLRLIAA